MQQKPIKNTTPPIMSPSQHQHGVMMTLRSLQPNPSLGLIIRLSWSHSFLIIQLDGGCTVSTGAQQQQFGGDHDSSDALMQLKSNVQVQKTKKYI